MDRSRGPPRQAMPSLLTLEKRRDSCPLWVISGQHVRAMSALPPKADMARTIVMSALCQKQTHALQQTMSAFENKADLRGRGAGASGVIDSDQIGLRFKG